MDAKTYGQSLEGQAEHKARSVATMVAVFAAVSLVVLDAAIANLALPAIARSMHVTAAQSVGVMTAYQLALVAALLPCGALGEAVGYRRVFAAGVALFTAASLLCAFAPSLPWLLAGRFLQGLGGSAVMSLGMALMRQVTPPERLGTVIGWNAMVVAFSAAAGPAIGAAVLSVASWPWLFAVNLPIGLAVLAAWRVLPTTPGSKRSVDGLSAALNAIGFGALVIGAEFLSKQWPLAIGLWLAAGVAFTLLVRREAGQAAPLIPLDLLRVKPFRVSVLASICCFAGQSAALVSLPFYLQHGLKQSALVTGLCMTPWPVAVMVVAPLSGRLADKVSGAVLCMVGGALFAVGLILAVLLPLHGNPWPLAAITALCGVGFGLFQTPNNRSLYLSTPRERSGAAGGMQATARLTGQTAGAVLMTALFGIVSLDHAPRIGLGLGAALALAAGLISLARKATPSA